MTHRGGIAEDELVERAAKGGVKVYGLSGALISPDPGIFASILRSYVDRKSVIVTYYAHT